jgi:hypothetical protein
MASKMPHEGGTMLRHRVCAALALAMLLLLGRGVVAFANADACWNPAFNDPTRVDISDISDLIAENETVLHNDPMDDVRRALLAALRSAGRVVLASTAAIDDASPGAHRPRAPPVA